MHFHALGCTLEPVAFRLGANLNLKMQYVNRKMKKTSSTLFPARLKELRGAISQKEMAKILDIPQQTYAGWELGNRQPKLEKLMAIALQFAVSTDWLLGLEDSSSRRTVTAVGGSAAAANGSTATVSTAPSAEVDRLLGIIEHLTGVKGAPYPSAVSDAPSDDGKNPRPPKLPAEQPQHDPLKPSDWRPKNW